MNVRALFGVCALLAQTSIAEAEPCVSAAFDQPVPGAVSVVTHRVDVPSPQFPGLWQEGVLGGYFYTLFANGEGLLQSSRKNPDWQITFTCDDETKTCVRSHQGSPAPAETAVIADKLEQCLVSPQSVKEVAAPAPQKTPPVVDATSPAFTPPPCGLKAIAAGAEGITLQRLLVLGGADPGPIDGYPGKRTETAIVELLGAEGANLSIADAIVALDQLLCSQTNQ